MPITDVAQTGAAAPTPLTGGIAGTLATRPHRRSALRAIFGQLHDKFDKAPYPAPALAITYGGVRGCLLRVDGADLQTFPGDTGYPGIALDLRGLTVGQVVATIAAVPGYDAHLSGPIAAGAPAVCLVDGIQDLILQPQLGYATSLLWCLLKPVAVALDRAADDVAAAVQQLDPRLASGGWLDLYGRLFDQPRPPTAAGLPSGDTLYRRQIAYQALAPKANPLALQLLLFQVLGVTATVSDATGVAFVAGPTTTTSVFAGTAVGGLSYGVMAPGPIQEYQATVRVLDANGFAAAQIQALVDRCRAPGVTATVVMPS